MTYNYLADGPVRELDSFARALSAAIGASDPEERESSNYPEGRYFRAYLGGATLRVSVADEDAHPDLPFWISMKKEGSDSPRSDDFERILRERAVSKGFRVAVMVHMGRNDEMRVDL